MSRILLLSTNTAQAPYPVYPLGMATIAAALAAKGHEVRQLDLLAQALSAASLRQTVRDAAPDVIGVSLRNIDNVDSLSAADSWT
ncbi:MAG: cobalamin-dependent protein, partial [bacterium]